MSPRGILTILAGIFIILLFMGFSTFSTPIKPTCAESALPLKTGIQPKSVNVRYDIIGILFNQKCNGNLEYITFKLSAGVTKGYLGGSATLELNTNPQRHVVTTAFALNNYYEYYGYYELLGVGAGLLLDASSQSVGPINLCTCEGYRIDSGEWRSSTHYDIQGFDNPSTNVVIVKIGTYRVYYTEIKHWCPDYHGHIDIGGGQVQYLKSYYAGPPR